MPQTSIVECMPDCINFKPLLHVETFSWNLRATALQKKFQQALHRRWNWSRHVVYMVLAGFWLAYAT